MMHSSNSQSISQSIQPNMSYRVLARRYRPNTFSDLVGQKVLVQILTHAIQSGRIAHAYILSGIRGTGKTTTARILARSLNCVGHDGMSGPTITPCGRCMHCQDISADQHVDVLEMDAASRTGVDDIREIIESAHYRPIHARYKVYILDEVHMLSNQAFNALLKTLEEPPEHTKFIFATTEIRKVPVTILSRCQRFDLQRVDIETLTQHLSHVAMLEKVTIEPQALNIIARAAGGSVRDSLSLLDQVITSSFPKDCITFPDIQAVLGLVDQTKILEILDATLHGDIVKALTLLTQHYNMGSDPALIVHDMLDLIHWLTRLKITDKTTDEAQLPFNIEQNTGKIMVKQLTIAVLSRHWQILLKALDEIRIAPIPIQAVEMAIIRAAYSANLPTPSDVIDFLRNPKSSTGCSLENGGEIENLPGSLPQERNFNKSSTRQVIRSLSDIIALCQAQGEILLALDLTNQLHLAHFEQGNIKLFRTPYISQDLVPKLTRYLREWTSYNWVITLSDEQEGRSLFSNTEPASAIPAVKTILETFPGSSIKTCLRISKDEPDISNYTENEVIEETVSEYNTLEEEGI